MVIADPSTELLGLIRATGDPAPSEPEPADRAAAHLLRRRFGLALPPPFIGQPSDAEPVRPAVAADGPAIAAVKWRTFGISYRGLLADDFLDSRGVVPSADYWVGRAMVPPSRRHGLWIWGRPGTVFGYLDAGPVVETTDADTDGAAGEVFELYVDPAAQGHGGGSKLLEVAIEHFTAVGFVRAELSTLTTNRPAQTFYERHGWTATGEVIPVDLEIVAFEEARYARHLGTGPA